MLHVICIELENLYLFNSQSVIISIRSVIQVKVKMKGRKSGATF